MHVCLSKEVVSTRRSGMKSRESLKVVKIVWGSRRWLSTWHTSSQGLRTYPSSPKQFEHPDAPHPSVIDADRIVLSRCVCLCVSVCVLICDATSMSCVSV
jgi:hypothetical protein